MYVDRFIAVATTDRDVQSEPNNELPIHHEDKRRSLLNKTKQ